MPLNKISYFIHIANLKKIFSDFKNESQTYVYINDVIIVNLHHYILQYKLGKVLSKSDISPYKLKLDSHGI